MSTACATLERAPPGAAPAGGRAISDFEFNSIIISILIAFALSEILTSWGRLIRRRDRVRKPYLYLAISSWLFFALILHWLGLSAYRELEIDRTWQSILIFLPSILGAAATFVLAPEFDDDGPIDVQAHYFSVVPWAFPLAAGFEIFSGFSDLLMPVEAPAPLFVFLAQGAVFLWLAFSRRRLFHRIGLAGLWSAVLIASLTGHA
jgi:hypothetical protein